MPLVQKRGEGFGRRQWLSSDSCWPEGLFKQAVASRLATPCDGNVPPDFPLPEFGHRNVRKTCTRPGCLGGRGCKGGRLRRRRLDDAIVRPTRPCRKILLVQ